MVLADGGLQFTVQERRSDGLVVLRAENSGLVTSRKGRALPGKVTRVRALTENRLNTVDQNRFTRAGLTGEGIEAVFERNDRGLNHGEIFNRKFL